MYPRQDAFGQYERSDDNWLFQDRAEAGIALAAALRAYRGSNALVLGVPRGGVPVAYEVAKRIDADLDVIVARKIGAPDQPELGIGAVAADGTLYVNEPLRKQLGVSHSVFAALAQAQQEEARRREARFRGGAAKLSPAGRIVIVVDDGLATGATLRAALRSLRNLGAERIVVAVPVGALDTTRSIAAEVDTVVCLQQPEPFLAVGQHYRVFAQTSDAEVEHLLLKARALRAQKTASGPHGL